MPPSPSPRPILTHFLAIPLVTPVSRPQLTESLAAFRADVCTPSGLDAGFGGAGVPVVPDESIRPVGTLHLTLGVMSFPGGERLGEAAGVLRALKGRDIWRAVQGGGTGTGAAASDSGGEAIVVEEKGKTTRFAVKEGSAAPSPPPSSPTRLPMVTLRGLHTMQPSAAKATVLYAPPTDPVGRLRLFCERVRGEFISRGLMTVDERPLKLHATIVNTVYVKGRGASGGSRGRGRGGRGGKERVTIDATDVLERYEDFVWLEDFEVEKIAICRMGAKKIERDGAVVDEAYEVEAEVDV